MKKLSLLKLALPGILVLISSCGQSQPPAIDASALYEANCVACHGANRQGISELGPTLTPQSLAELNDTEIRDAILKGRPGTAMVGFKDRLNQEEIDALIRLIKHTSP
jgi:mono/diheme cytochrome c family protein